MFTMTTPNLFPRDIEAAVAFYRTRWDSRRTIRCPARAPRTRGAAARCLAARPLHAQGVNAAGLDPTQGNSYELIVWCADVDAEVARLRADGVVILVDPYDHIGGHRRAYISDPNGNWLAVVDAG